MKLTDLIYGAGGVVRDATNFVRYPTQIVSQHLRRIAQEKFEAIELPLQRGEPGKAGDRRLPDPRSVPEPTRTRIQQTGDRPPPTNHQGIIEREGAQKVLDYSPNQDFSNLEAEIFPKLEGKPINGQRGRYKVEHLLVDGDQTRQYRGRSLSSNLLVIVKEYRLVDFSPKEIEQVRDNLDNIGPVSLRSGGVQDFRLIVPWDMWANGDEKRGYLIIRDILEHRLSLRQYLKRAGKLSPREVRRVLEQVLQSLWFLHNHKIRFADGKTQSGMAHGNLSLDSLSIVPNRLLPDHPPTDEPQFQIYLGDLALWENAFQPSQPITSSDPQETGQSALVPTNEASDFHALGQVGFALLMGEVSDHDSIHPLDPARLSQWAAIGDSPLKNLIGRLLDQEDGFSNAEEAYKAVRELPDRWTEPEVLASDLAADQDVSLNKSVGCLKPLLLVMLLGFLGWLSWRWLSHPSAQPAPISSLLLTPPKLPTAIRGIDFNLPPNRSFKYAVTPIWKDAIGQRRVSQIQNFQDELKQRDPRFKVFSSLIPKLSYPQSLNAGEIAFLLGEKDDALDNTKFRQEIVAYDGLVVFVAASDPQRPGNVPLKLQGKISFDRLRKIYTGEVQEFQPYRPTDQLAVDLFWKVVLQNDQDKIRKFKQVTATQKKSQNSQLEKIFQDFEDTPHQKPGIGFARLSKVFGQCSAYPLAIGEVGQEQQVLIQVDGTPIQPAQIDLCNAKGSYWADAAAFTANRYPLIYPLVVIYPIANSQPAETFIAALKTDEGQCLLSEAGLVPIEPVRQRGICDGSSK